MARAVVLLGAVLVSFGLVVTAGADPPDPTWIAGMWDDDDEDNAVVAIQSIPGWVEAANPDPITLLETDPLVVIPKKAGPATPIFVVVESRAPPPASSRPV